MADERDPEEPAIVRTDKRKITADGQVRFPTAQQLLDETNTQDAMTDEEKESLLARQAAEYEGVPYEGGGIEAPVEPNVPNYRTAFTVLISEMGVPSIVQVEVPHKEVDGEPTEEPVFTYDRDPNNRDIWLACTEIAGDINRAETAMVTANALAQQATAGMARQQAAMNQAREAMAGRKGRRN